MTIQQMIQGLKSIGFTFSDEDEAMKLKTTQPPNMYFHLTDQSWVTAYIGAYEGRANVQLECRAADGTTQKLYNQRSITGYWYHPSHVTSEIDYLQSQVR